MKNPALSLIIPCFKAEAFVKRCIESATDSSIELICVVDASPDESLDALKRIQKANADLNLKIIQNEKNLGPHQSRIKGLQIACGDYIGFMDADDHLQPEATSELVKMLATIESDVYVYGTYKVHGSTKTPDIRFAKDGYATGSHIENFCNFKYGSGYLCNKVYKRDAILQAFNTTNKLQITKGEDYAVNFEVFKTVESVYLNSKLLYNYEQHPNSLSHKDDYAKNLINLLTTYAAILDLQKLEEEETIDLLDRLFLQQFKFPVYHPEAIDQTISDAARAVLMEVSRIRPHFLLKLALSLKEKPRSLKENYWLARERILKNFKYR